MLKERSEQHTFFLFGKIRPGVLIMYENIVTWYRENKRDLEFRKYNDPYAIWVSEIMAQQTQIVTMIPYFIKWMESFPTIQACADADEITILKHWEGLGYYRRARLLHKGCQYVCKQYDGVFPNKFIDIIKIPGIGNYTGAAIASIVFNEKTPAVDGNVIRVISRFHAIDDYVDLTSTKRDIEAVLLNWMNDCDLCDYSSFTQGIMEIGALVCTPKNPECTKCPLKINCIAYRSGNPMDYPKKKPKEKIPTFEFATLICTDDGKIVLSSDWSDGLMKGLYRLPQIPIDTFNSSGFERIGSLNHIFSHKRWVLHIFKRNSLNFKSKDSFVINVSNLDEYPLITAHKKIIYKYLLAR